MRNDGDDCVTRMSFIKTSWKHVHCHRSSNLKQSTFVGDSVKVNIEIA